LPSSLPDIQPIAKGGTGINTAPTKAGQFLRSPSAGNWDVGSIIAADLPPGAIAATHVSPTGGVVAFNNPLYAAEATTTTAAAGTTSTVIASCTSANDILVSGGCYNGATANVPVIGTYPVPGSPGAWHCDFQSTGAGIAVVARAMCYPHP